jgi:glycosyltransferase involved in cell wall biosynthesis
MEELAHVGVCGGGKAEANLCMRILVSAYACEPGKGSEPAIGWDSVRQIARFHEVWVATRASNRRSIAKALAIEPVPNVHWIFIDLPAWARFWKRGQRGVHLYYCIWQFIAYWIAKKWHRKVSFELVHHVTFVNYWMPSFLALLPVPFVWGPVGGGESAPRSFWFAFSLRGKMCELLRDISRKIGEQNPIVRLTARRAVWAFSTTEETEKRLRHLGCRRVRVFPQVGLPAEEMLQLVGLPFREEAPFRLLSAGRVIHWKGFELGIKAFAQFQRQFPTSEYWLVGDGPERTRLEALAAKLDVAEKVMFYGSVSRSELFQKLAECDVLMHPSLHDSGGYIVLEAMAAGRPPVCLDLGGPGVLVTKETGMKIRALDPVQVIQDLTEALSHLARNPALRVSLGQAARIRVKECFVWDKKGATLVSSYLGLKSAITES